MKRKQAEIKASDLCWLSLQGWASHYWLEITKYAMHASYSEDTYCTAMVRGIVRASGVVDMM
jgi:hypothetical protein